MEFPSLLKEIAFSVCDIFLLSVGRGNVLGNKYQLAAKVNECRAFSLDSNVGDNRSSDATTTLLSGWSIVLRWHDCTRTNLYQKSAMSLFPSPKQQGWLAFCDKLVQFAENRFLRAEGEIDLGGILSRLGPSDGRISLILSLLLFPC